MQEGLATNGVIFIPELIPIGEKTILSYLQNDAINADLGQTPAEFYFVMVRLAIQAGLAFGEKWHLDFSGLQNGYVEQVMNRGAAQVSNHILAWLGLYEDEEQDEFYKKIFERWVELHEPYWKLKDARQHTFKAILAAYQLGISMVLCKYGF